MSIKCVAERYNATRLTLRVSLDKDSLADIRDVANRIATDMEMVFGTKGSNITYCDGRWDREIENGAIIEIVLRESPTNEQMEIISYRINVGAGVSCFATVDNTVAFELYELAE